MIAIVAFEVTIIYKAFSKKGEIESNIDDRLLKTIRESGDKKVYLESWNVLQKEVKTTAFKSMI